MDIPLFSDLEENYPPRRPEPARTLAAECRVSEKLEGSGSMPLFPDERVVDEGGAKRPREARVTGLQPKTGRPAL